MSESDDLAVGEKLTATIRYRDAQGYMQELRITAAEARTIRRIRQQYKRADKRWREHHVAFTDVNIAAASVEGTPLPPVDLGNAPEGPWFRFSWLVGESRSWSGEPVDLSGFCALCRCAKLPRHGYCLGCDACGRELEIPSPGEAKKKATPRFRAKLKERKRKK